MVSVYLGAGRVLKTDPVDFHAGMIWHYKWGDKVKKDENLVTCYSSKSIDKKEISNRILKCIKISSKKPQQFKAIKKIFYID